MFGLQDGGFCVGDNEGLYAKHGESTACMHGKGGSWANDVYRVQGKMLLLHLRTDYVYCRL